MIAIDGALASLTIQVPTVAVTYNEI
jgi:hypothetical protein